MLVTPISSTRQQCEHKFPQKYSNDTQEVTPQTESGEHVIGIGSNLPPSCEVSSFSNPTFHHTGHSVGPAISSNIVLDTAVEFKPTPGFAVQNLKQYWQLFQNLTYKLGSLIHLGKRCPTGGRFTV